ncbi:MAG: hypothetical protein ACOCPT_02720 [Halanaeroarchaeum sp.]
MNGRKALSLALAGIAVVTLAFGTGAFTSVSAERGVSVSVADDDSAYVGYESSDVTVSDGDNVELVTVTNRFQGDLNVTSVDISAGSMSFTNLSYPTMESGESGAITGDVEECEAGTTETVQVTVTVSGTGVWAKIYGDSETQEREFDVECAAPAKSQDNYVEFKGGGQVRINENPPNDIDLVYWTTEKKSNDRSFAIHRNESFNTSDKLQEKSSPKIVAVYIPEENKSYYHPGFDLTNKTISNWGTTWKAADSDPGNVSLGS